MIGFKVVDYLIKKQWLFDIIFAAFLISISLLLNQAKVLERWDNLLYDYESSLITRPVDESIVIVAIDDVSLRKIGRWPWSRAVHARFLDQLTEVDVTAIGFDILFMEPDLRQPEDDELLAEAIRRNGRVVLPVLTNVQEDSIVITKSLEQITDAAQLAHVNLSVDNQGIVRDLDLLIKLDDGEELPSMALALYQKKQGSLTFLDKDARKNIYVAFSNPPGQFRQVSYSDVLLDASIRKSLHGKVILVGVTAAGLGSKLATPGLIHSRLMPGVEFQANALNTLLSGEVILPLKWPGYLLISTLLIIIPVLIYRFFKPGMTLVLALGFSILTCLSSFVLLRFFQLWFAPLSTLLCLIFSYPVWSLRKLSQLKRSLFKQNENASAVLNAIEDSVIVTNKRGCIEFMNPAAEKMLAYSLAEAKLLPFSELYEIVEQYESTLWDSNALSNTKEDRKAEIQFIRNRHNEEFAVRISSRLVYAENGLSEGVVYALSDLTEMINVSKRNAYIATHDVLTGLPNRALLKSLTEQAIKNDNREGVGFAVLFIDLDGFKKINDGMGHASGDFLLQEIARRLRSWARQSDTISRWGGDEFIILLDKVVSVSDVADLAEKINYTLSQPFMIDHQKVFVTTSIGISFFPDDGKEVDVLLEKADAAMYNVKASGRNDFCFYSQGLETQAKNKLLLENELRHALNNNEFEVYYQPQFDITFERLIGMEALIRWRHPKKGLLVPDQFISLAEESGLIVPIGKWIVKNVCQQLKLWKDIGLPIMKVAINISARQLLQKDLVSSIIQEVELSDISPDLLQVEITESMIIKDVDLVVEVIGDLKSKGISIAIDDFGTGYSSFEYLKKLPIDKLKIDKSFVGSVMSNLDDANIVQAVIAMGHNMNIQIIAEGVETEEQLKFLLERQCDYAQGYFFSEPVPAKKIEDIIQKFRQLGKA